MNADNVVLLFMLVWTFTAVCQADEDIFSVSCDDVTGSVGKEVTLTCRVSLLFTECCITRYKFQYPESINDSVICQDFSVNSCEQRNSFTCRYTPTTAITEQFRFLMQTECGFIRTEFTVDIAESIKHKPDTEAPGKKGIVIEAIVITAVSCFIIVIITVTAITCVKRFIRTNPSGLQKKYERGVSEEQTVMTTNV